MSRINYRGQSFPGYNKPVRTPNESKKFKVLAKVKDKAEEAVTKGAIQGLTTRTKYAVAGEPPTSRQLVTYADTGGLPTTGSGMGIFNTTDLTQQSFQMNNWQDISQYYAVPVNQRLG